MVAPRRRRTRCGITRPTKPIMPLTDTTARRAATPRRRHRARRGTPSRRRGRPEAQAVEIRARASSMARPMKV
jgi:hypothetical protein